MIRQVVWLLVFAALFCCTLLACSRSKQKHEESEYSLYSMRQKELREATTSGVVQPTADASPTAEPESPSATAPPTASTPPAASIAQQPDSSSRYEALLTGLTIFVLAIFVGFEVITKVPTTLHTPLMSGSNAISGITLVGAVLMAGLGLSEPASYIGFLAVVLATVNVVGGFVVTHRMLAMFKRR